MNNSHNRHNTGNINEGLTPLDYKENMSFEKGIDDELATSISMLTRVKNKQQLQK